MTPRNWLVPPSWSVAIVLLICLATRGAASRAWAGPPTDLEQYLVELINRDRADPAAAAARYGIDLNEGLPAGTLSTAPRQPLAINPALTSAAHDYVEYLRANGLFSHVGPGSLSPGDRMVAAGYAPANSFSWGENLAYIAGPPFSVSLVETLNRNLFVDANISGRGHRIGMLNNGYTEVGPGVAVGAYKPPGGSNYSSAMLVGEDFGNRSSARYLTGVAYQDASHDAFYQPGEGLGGVTVVATRQSNGQQYVMTTWNSGGYSLGLPSGSYQVAAFGGTLGGTVLAPSISLGGTNVKVDFLTGDILLPGDANGDRIVDGGDYTAWANNFLGPNLYHNGTTGDFSGNGIVDAGDYTIWANHFQPGLSLAAVPEPASMVQLLAAGLCGLLILARRARATRSSAVACGSPQSA